MKSINLPSKKRVNLAGIRMKSGAYSGEDLKVVNEWRAAHRGVLNTFQALFRGRTKGQGIVVAQRHKRLSTILNKLHRYPRMQLARMDDVAGCRLIFNDIEEMYEFRSEIHKARFRHIIKNAVDKYDYVKSPKHTGYRGVHDVYSYDANSVQAEPLKGLLIEIQYRTFVQHAWATAVEVIGFLTASRPKFEEGDLAYVEVMRYASEILARAHEGKKSCLQDIDDESLIHNFLEIERKVDLFALLHSLNVRKSDYTDKKNFILIFDSDGGSEIRPYRRATEALRALFELENQMPGKDIVLVKADTSEEVRAAFRNYFSDASEFLSLLESGCEVLSGKKSLRLAADRKKV